MIVVLGKVQALVRIDMAVPGKAEEEDRITASFDGCGYNVAKKLAALGHDVFFISAVSDDPMGMAALADLERSKVDTRGISVFENGEGVNTAIKVEARNFLGDPQFLRTDEKIMEVFTPEMALDRLESLKDIRLVFADGSFNEETLIQLGEECRRRDIKLFFDPGSDEGAERGRKALDHFYGIMPGRREAEMLSGFEILSAEQLEKAGEYFADKGVENTVITLKGGGIYYRSGDEEGVIRPERKIQFADTKGAGDVVTATLIDGYIREMSPGEWARCAMDAAAEYLADIDDVRAY